MEYYLQGSKVEAFDFSYRNTQLKQMDYCQHNEERAKEKYKNIQIR